jgi:hypothetical protein
MLNGVTFSLAEVDEGYLGGVSGFTISGDGIRFCFERLAVGGSSTEEPQTLSSDRRMSAVEQSGHRNTSSLKSLKCVLHNYS